jgi:hypothetical protein
VFANELFDQYATGGKGGGDIDAKVAHNVTQTFSYIANGRFANSDFVSGVFRERS